MNPALMVVRGFCYNYYMKNYFVGTKDHPQHVSVGAMLINNGVAGSPQDKNKICCHHFTPDLMGGYWPDLGLKDFYLLMRKTLHIGESLEQAVKRGLMEEFGAEGEILDYIGSIKSKFRHKEGESEVEKTTLYFVCKLVSKDESKRNNSDIEGKTKIEWCTAEFLIPKMKEQGHKYGREDVDESEILEKYLRIEQK